MKIRYAKFHAHDTVEQIAEGLKLRPRNYILFKETKAFGGEMSGVLGGNAYRDRKKAGAVAISILQ